MKLVEKLYECYTGLCGKKKTEPKMTLLEFGTALIEVYNQVILRMMCTKETGLVTCSLNVDLEPDLCVLMCVSKQEDGNYSMGYQLGPRESIEAMAMQLSAPEEKNEPVDGTEFFRS